MMFRADRNAIQPLFAGDAPLWLALWVGTQTVGLVAAMLLAGLTAHVLSVVALVVAYDAVGVTGYRWILRRWWAVLMYVAVGWVLLWVAIHVHGAFSLLVFGAVIQAFIFLPFAWAAAWLALLAVLSCVALIAQAQRVTASTLLAQLSVIIATGTTIGTVLLYINRANRDATIRTDLLRRLDAARLDLAQQAHRSGVLEERQRLSRDLHDTLAQTLASVVRHLEAVQLELASRRRLNGAAADESSLTEVVSHLARAEGVSREGLAEIRALVLALRPNELADAPLGSAVERVISQWGRDSGVQVQSSIAALPALETDVEVTILRGLQESLNNVSRHARAQHVRVSVACVDDLALLTVEDDGCGFDEAAASSSDRVGLSGMRERVRRCGGYVLIDSTPGSGTSLTIAVPLATAAPAVPGRGGS
jgi:signal transduction histidine kinase